MDGRSTTFADARVPIAELHEAPVVVRMCRAEDDSDARLEDSLRTDAVASQHPLSASCE